MSGTLEHTAADVLRYLLVNLGLGTLPTASGSWPIGVDHEPDKPDNAITIYDTAPKMQGRRMTDGIMQEHYGVQIRVRCIAHATGVAKAQAFVTALDQTIENNSITVGSDTYIVYAVTRTTGVLSIGREPQTNRPLFTINAVVALRQTS